MGVFAAERSAALKFDRAAVHCMAASFELRLCFIRGTRGTRRIDSAQN
jgi:hypothetical protein